MGAETRLAMIYSVVELGMKNYVLTGAIVGLSATIADGLSGKHKDLTDYAFGVMLGLIVGAAAGLWVRWTERPQ